MDKDTDTENVPGLEPFDSVPFIPECEVIQESGHDEKLKYDLCKKNPGHSQFIPVKEFKRKHLPSELQRVPGIMKSIRTLCELTVKLTILHTSENRPDRYPTTNAPYPYANLKGEHHSIRCGTGFIERDLIKPAFRTGPCPCSECNDSQRPTMRFWEWIVMTASHVVYDASEAASTVVDLFYDDEERLEVKSLYGIVCYQLNEKKKYVRDINFVLCVTHDKETSDRLMKISNNIETAPVPKGVMVSHPHGRSKVISVGRNLDETVVRGLDRHFTFADVFRQFRSETLCRDFKTPLKLKRLSKSAEKAIPTGSVLEIPENGKYIMRSMQTEDGRKVSFPPGTSALTPDGKAVPVSSETLFSEDDFEQEELLSSTFTPMFLTYDTPTCPGSSGARVFRGDDMDLCYAVHAGGLRKGNNRSGVIVKRGLRGQESSPPEWKSRFPRFSACAVQ